MFPRNRPGLVSQGTAAQQVRSPADETPANPPPPSTPPKQTQNYGLYKDGKWYCNCKPRARAKYLPVKKSGPNKGRCFYSCPDKDNGCDFFYWVEEADERAAAQGDGSDAATTTPRPKKDQSIRKYLQPRTQNGDPPGLETPTKGGGDVMEIDADGSSSRPANEEMCCDDQQEQGRLSTPPVPADRTDPITPIRRPPKRRREDDDDEYSMLDFSPSEEEQIEQILSAASCRSNMSPPAAPAETPSRRPDSSSSTLARPRHVQSGFATPSTESSLGTTRRRILDSNNSIPRNPTTPQQGISESHQVQTPNADTAASINAEISSVRALLAGHLDATISAQLETHLTRITMKVKCAAAQREMLREALGKREKELARLRETSKTLTDEATMLREARAKTRAKMMEIYKDT